MNLKQVLVQGIFIVVIALSIMDIMQIANGEIRLFKELLSWIIIGYFIYNLSPTKLLFKNQHKRIDLFLLLSLYFFVFKDFSYIVLKEELIYTNFLKTFILKYQFVNEVMFGIGAILIFILSVYLGIKFKFEKDSILGLIRHPDSQHTTLNKLFNVLLIYTILISFSYFIFTIMMEWFVLVLDSYFACAALIYYSIYYFVIKKNKGFSQFIYSVVNTGSNFLQKFLNLFHDKKTIFYGISGIIVIHGLVDIGNFMIPYLFNVSNLYLDTLSASTHETIFNLFLSDFSRASLFDKFCVAIIYFQNVFALISLLFIPFYMWLKIITQKEISFNKYFIALLFSSVFCFLISPVLKIEALKNQALVGVDITTQGLNNIGNLYFIAIFSVFILIISWILFSFDSLKNKSSKIVVFFSTIFFGIYIYKFYSSTLLYYLSTIQYLFSNNNFLIAFYMMVYLLTTTLFYIGGFILLVFEICKCENFNFLNINLKLQKFFVFLWTLTLFFSLIFFMEANKIIEMIIMLLCSTLLSLLYMKYDKESAKYVLMVNMSLITFICVMLIIPFFKLQSNFSEAISRILLLTLIIVITIIFKIRINLKVQSYIKLLFALVIGIVSGFWFYLIGEPTVQLLYNNLVYILFFSLLVAVNEELIFRFLILKSGLVVYSKKIIILIQGLFFAILHLLNFMFFLGNLGGLMFLTLFISLFIFGIIMGILSIEKDYTVNPIYAIVCHTVAVGLLYLL
jgi:CAAX prenyl protease-like protein